jgi:hypothetical protein
MKLTDTQLVVLSAASQRQDGAIELTPNLKGGSADEVVRRLLNEGLIEEVPAAGSLPLWRRDDHEVRWHCGSRNVALRPSGLGSTLPRTAARLPSPKSSALPISAGAPLRGENRQGRKLREGRPSLLGRTQSRPV